MSLGQWGYLLLLSVLWGGSFFFVGVAVEAVPPFTVVLCRVTLAALALWALVGWFRLEMPASLSGWAPFVVMALINNVTPFTLITIGQRDVASALASILNATTPLWTVLIAHAFTSDEKLTAQRLAGVLMGLLGVAVLLGPEAARPGHANLAGMILILAATVSYGFAGLWGRRLRGSPPLVSAAAQLTASSVILLPAALIVDAPWRLALPDPSVIAALIGLALLSTAAAYVVFFHILAVSGSTSVMLVTLLIPVSATTLGVLVLGERLTALQVAGAAVIAAALIVFDGRLIDRLGRARRG